MRIEVRFIKDDFLLITNVDRYFDYSNEVEITLKDGTVIVLAKQNLLFYKVIKEGE